jgi:hypothetical protein
MKRTTRMRFWFEAAIAGASAILCIITLITREWVEALTGWDPDHHSGSFEWILVIVLAVTACLAAGFARANSQRQRRSRSWQPLPTDARVSAFRAAKRGLWRPESVRT